jgi:hypothetical protein
MAPSGTSTTMPTVDQMRKRLEIWPSDRPVSAKSSA